MRTITSYGWTIRSSITGLIVIEQREQIGESPRVTFHPREAKAVATALRRVAQSLLASDPDSEADIPTAEGTGWWVYVSVNGSVVIAADNGTRTNLDDEEADDAYLWRVLFDPREIPSVAAELRRLAKTVRHECIGKQSEVEAVL